MREKFDYTKLVNRFASKFPLISYVGIQINFWIVANVLVMYIMHTTSRFIGQTFQVSVSGPLTPLLLIALFMGVAYGLILGPMHYFLDQKYFRNLALGKVIVLKAITSLGVLILIFFLLKHVLFALVMSPAIPEDYKVLSDESWGLLFRLFVIYYFLMTLLISFINQVNKKYGPGILLPLLLGNYRNPKEEHRIFMFMDLKSSTSTAERLGHLKYSSFIRDCFLDINSVLHRFRAQIYQYVGDEIVVTWPESDGLKDHFCVQFYFACQEAFQNRSAYYMTVYGLLPEFKAGIHTGVVTTVEIGDVKRDIAHHGDTLNTTARIQSICNEKEKRFIASKTLLDKLGPHHKMQTQDLGKVLLKGKLNAVELLSIDGWS
ncbi:adenylate/guanylate cyclase domain-containing protein [Chryseosolibacter indicus]|uniref:Adenylate/guanylate cyclase domain-containing protein n=1 Tax=Chryseosolibacter indicus TaxID=2782351 RepID=A0ABS5VXP3_9BACT|nr:adenylate/guanylate cyclase domain-containing protein [Chryseosolibacter indicus]MBT1705833.1 adenylate/guanylate cyclase domain-containing protein [Chryseosolibacter indicus]